MELSTLISYAVNNFFKGERLRGKGSDLYAMCRELDKALEGELVCYISTLLCVLFVNVTQGHYSLFI